MSIVEVSLVIIIEDLVGFANRFELDLSCFSLSLGDLVGMA